MPNAPHICQPGQAAGRFVINCCTRLATVLYGFAFGRALKYGNLRPERGFMPVPRRIFLLSPARLDGERARLLFHPVTMFPLARALHAGGGATIGEVFSFLSGLYFRGKLAYAEAFARPPRKLESGSFVITTNRGLLTPSTRVSLDDLASLARTEIGRPSEQFRVPLQRDAASLARALGRRGEIVLLGSIASAKYIDVLLSVFDEQLLFPQEFVGRGDMSRGGLLLRCVDANLELAYTPVRGAVRHGVRPPKLSRRR
jgi:hypothetical protein